MTPEEIEALLHEYTDREGIRFPDPPMDFLREVAALVRELREELVVQQASGRLLSEITDRLRAENAELKAKPTLDNVTTKEALRSEYIVQLQAENAEQARVIGELREKLDWLWGHTHGTYDAEDGEWLAAWMFPGPDWPASIDEAIDAALRQTEETSE